MLDTNWTKSSLSFSNGNCLEARWQKSSHSAGSNCLEGRWKKSTHSVSGGCVEARQDGAVQIRDSKLGDASAILSFTPSAWEDFLTTVRRPA